MKFYNVKVFILLKKTKDKTADRRGEKTLKPPRNCVNGGVGMSFFSGKTQERINFFRLKNPTEPARNAVKPREIALNSVKDGNCYKKNKKFFLAGFK